MHLHNEHHEREHSPPPIFPPLVFALDLSGKPEKPEFADFVANVLRAFEDVFFFVGFFEKLRDVSLLFVCRAVSKRTGANALCELVNFIEQSW